MPAFICECALKELREQGFVVIDDFLSADEVTAARDGMWMHFPTRAEFDASPARRASLGANQFAGIIGFPFRSSFLNALAISNPIVDAAARYLGQDQIDLHSANLWAKYAGQVDYTQSLHRDYFEKTLTGPADAPEQVSIFILLSDVSDDSGPTAFVPRSAISNLAHTDQLRSPLDGPAEVLVTGPAGTAYMFDYDSLHRATGMRDPKAARFILTADYKLRGRSWLAASDWPAVIHSPEWVAAFADMTPRQRDLFGFPLPDSSYWTNESVRLVSARWPMLDMRPYAASVRSSGNL